VHFVVLCCINLFAFFPVWIRIFCVVIAVRLLLCWDSLHLEFADQRACIVLDNNKYGDLLSLFSCCYLCRGLPDVMELITTCTITI
jgi:hypothetical protein